MDTNNHAGHRKRIMAKIKNGNMQEYEFLEAILFNALPRRNTSDIVHRLFSHFGTVDGIFSASVEELQSVKGIGESIACYLFCVGELARHYNSQKNWGVSGKYNSVEFEGYLPLRYEDLKIEVCDVYLVDDQDMVSLHKRFTNDDPERGVIDPTDFSRIFFRENTKGVILVHNHPNGRLEPSALDDETTKKCQVLCSYHNKKLLDHYICTPNGVYSYRKDGDLAKIKEKFFLPSMVKVGKENNE